MPGSDRIPEPAGTFRAVSYNVHGCTGPDRRCLPARVARVIAESRADVVGLQEVDTCRGPGGREQWRALAEALGMWAVPGPTLRRQRGPFGNALLSRYPVEEVRTIDLGVSGREPRRAIDADLRIDGGRWRVVVTHLGLRIAERRVQTSLLLERLVGGPGTPSILLADINAWWPWSYPLRRLRAAFGPARPVPTYPSRHPILPLDRIWVHPPAALVRTFAHGSRMARAASDHLPVCAVLRRDGGPGGPGRGPPG